MKKKKSYKKFLIIVLDNEMMNVEVIILAIQQVD